MPKPGRAPASESRQQAYPPLEMPEKTPLEIYQKSRASRGLEAVTASAFIAGEEAISADTDTNGGTLGAIAAAASDLVAELKL
jgi:hypothetical protein